MKEEYTELTLWARKCTNCGTGMIQGYVVKGGDEYYCSPLCLHEHYTEQEWDEMTDGGTDEYNYWTQWEDESDMQYKFINGELIEIYDEED